MLSCILERQTATDECIAVGNTNCRTARFDKNRESGRLVEVKVKPVDSTVKEEFYQTIASLIGAGLSTPEAITAVVIIGNGMFGTKWKNHGEA